MSLMTSSVPTRMKHPCLAYSLVGKHITYMTTCRGPQLQYTYNIIHILEYSYLSLEFIT